MRFRAMTLLAILAATAAEAGDGVVPVSRAEIVYNTIFLNHSAKKWEKLPIGRPVSDQVLRLIPETDGAFKMIAIDCNEITVGGQLRECKTDVEPFSNALRAVAYAAIKDLRIDSVYARSVQGKVRFASIQIKVSRSLGPVTHGPCWPPSCILEPAPPSLPNSVN